MRRPTTAIFLALLLMQAGSSLTLQATDIQNNSNIRNSDSPQARATDNTFAAMHTSNDTVAAHAATNKKDIHVPVQANESAEMLKDAESHGASQVGANVNQADVLIYPNPADEYVTIQANDVAARVVIMDTRGNKLADVRINSGDLDVSALTAGVYLLRIFDRYDNMIDNELVVIQ